MDSRVQGLRVQPTTTFGPGGAVVREVTYTFYVEGHGPFTLTYKEGTDSVTQVQGDIATQVQKLQAIGAIQ